MTTAVLIVAAGTGNRAGGDLPKQFQSVAGEPVLRRTVRAFQAHKALDLIQLVIHPDHEQETRDCLAGLDVPRIAHGGATRQDSVRLGLEALAAQDQKPDTVLIHDAARPFVRADIISRVIAGVSDSGNGVIPALPVADSLKYAPAGQIEGAPSRDGLHLAQTPQGFPFDRILQAHRDQAGAEMTDDAAVFAAAGGTVRIIEGDPGNYKITHPSDFARAARDLAQTTETRTGMGFDVHRFEDGDNVTLCGVKIKHDKALKGHSDADVALHALTDAILGTIGAGDIGTHFPPSQAKWKDAPSSMFLAHALELLKERGGRLVNVDLTIICEAPKVGPHREAMTLNLSTLTRLTPDRISVKATTTEGLGFTGRGEGIAAQAIVSVCMNG